jgi:hypothetical protein
MPYHLATPAYSERILLDIKVVEKGRRLNDGTLMSADLR